MIRNRLKVALNLSGAAIIDFYWVRVRIRLSLVFVRWTYNRLLPKILTKKCIQKSIYIYIYNYMINKF